MATTKDDLALRLLKKLGVVGAGQPATAADLELAGEKIVSVHSFLVSQGKARWTLNDVPGFADEGYLLMGSALAAPEFGAPVDPGAWQGGMRMICAGAALGPSSDVIAAEYF